MAFNIIDEIKKRPRSEWQKLARDLLTRVRIWIQENGEAAFLLGLSLGFLVVVFYKFFIAVLAIGVILGFSFYSIAPESISPDVPGDLSVPPSSGPPSPGSGQTRTEKNEPPRRNDFH